MTGERTRGTDLAEVCPRSPPPVNVEDRPLSPDRLLLALGHLDRVALEDVAVARGIAGGGIGARHVDRVAQLGEELVLVGALGGARL